MNRHATARGFTIIEIILAVVVIGLIAALTMVAVHGAGNAGTDKQITSDLAALRAAITKAQANNPGVPLMRITGNSYTAGSCTSKPDGTDLAQLPRTDRCWTDYYSALDRISEAAYPNGLSGQTDLHGLADPYGRPYYIDENESERQNNPCIRDYISVFSRPFTSGAHSLQKFDRVGDFNTPLCQRYQQ